MNAGRMYKYYWSDSSTSRPRALPAPHYIDNLMTWISELLDDESVFPTRQEGTFPSDIRSICGKIFRRLFRVYAHIYICHMDDIRRLQEEAHLNTSFKHFIYFVQEFQEHRSIGLRGITGWGEGGIDICISRGHFTLDGRFV